MIIEGLQNQCCPWCKEFDRRKQVHAGLTFGVLRENCLPTSVTVPHTAFSQVAPLGKGTEFSP
eukprot:846608-Amphidinium_carterae.1